MLIAFVHSGRSFMPEVSAYIKYFSARNIACVVTTPGKLKNINCDVEWFFLGMDHSKPKKAVVRIHEYTSLSTPPAARLKDYIKHKINTTPDFRIFLNKFVAERMGFNDGVPFGFRDMGIPQNLLVTPFPLRKKTVDFIYIGDVGAQRQMDALLGQFTKDAWKDKSILIISQHYSKLAQRFKNYRNIVFKGPLSHDAVMDELQTARYALNYIPDIAPFNRQTSTKLLEYAAGKIPIISTSYQWITEFRAANGGDYFFLEPSFGNFNWEAVSNFNYSFPDLSNWTWDQQIERSGVLQFLQTRFPAADPGFGQSPAGTLL
ncbi:MAG: hypothetical protein ABIU63_13815 [Chitinophagaceae bacterium]